GSPTSRLVRDMVRSADELRIIRGLVGYASSLAALGAAPGLGAALARTVPGIPAYLERKGEDFAAIVARKRRRRVEVVSPWDVAGPTSGSAMSTKADGPDASGDEADQP
ncbi:MAG: hypothetical protein M0027_12440, partial [Candidatus Dormibacteraeota bacterium]|nr:hypothetical protein [Candidatus Dormibacteraeota bacterium]